jgi:HNH endonuclease
MIPRSVGGQLLSWNKVIACRRCNTHKGDRTIFQYQIHVAKKLRIDGFIFHNTLEWQWKIKNTSHYIHDQINKAYHMTGIYPPGPMVQGRNEYDVSLEDLFRKDEIHGLSVKC